MPLTDAQRRAIARMETMDGAMADVLRRKSPAERLEIAWGMWRSARTMLQCLVRSEHPDWPAEAVDHEVARRLSRGSG